MSAWEVKVHSDRDGRARCGHPRAREVTADHGAVTCQMCLNLLDGTHGAGNRRHDVKPCGTTAAYRRHLRHQGKPVRCETCLQAERRKGADAYRRAA
ncbi:MAG TPA: hypothetical protein VGG75_40080 [Trebonia sp.]